MVETVNKTPLSSLDVPVEQPMPLNLGTSYDSPPVTPEIANERALKAHYGLGGIVGGKYTDYNDAILSGQENSKRIEDSYKLDAIKRDLHQKKIQDLALERGQALSIDEVAKAIADQPKPQDPDSVFEDAYADKYVSALTDATKNLQGSFMDSALVDPALFGRDKSTSKEVIGWRNFIQTQAQNIQSELEAQPWYQKAGYFAFGMLPMVYSGYREYMLRGNVPNEDGFQGLGGAIASQADALWKLPYAERKQKFKETLDDLKSKDLHVALDFAKYTLGTTESQKLGDDLFAPIDFLPFVGGMTDRAATALLKRGEAINAARTAAKTIAEAEARNPANLTPEAHAAQSAGDLKEAAVKQTAANLNKKFEGSQDPIKESLDFLPTALRMDWKAVESNSSNISRELRQRLASDYQDAEGALVDTLSNTLRPQRTEIATANEEQLRAIAKDTSARYPGDAIADVADPVYNRITNTWTQDLKLVNYDGGLFATREAAENLARKKGLDPAKAVEQGTGRTSSVPTGSPSDIKRMGQLETTIPFLEQQIVKNKAILANKKLDKEVHKEARATLKDAREILARYKGQQDDIKRRLKPTTVEQQGIGYYVRYTAPIDERAPSIRRLFSENADNASSATRGGKFEQWRNALTGTLRIADDTLAKNEVAQRKAATYPVANFVDLLRREGEIIADVAKGKLTIDPLTGESIRETLNPFTNKKYAAEFNEALDYARKAINPDTKKPGYFFQNPDDLAQFYQTEFKRLPSDAEVRGYFAYTRTIAYDWVLRNLSEYKYKARMGVEQHTFNYLDSSGNVVSSPAIEGTRVSKLPGGQDAILIADGIPEGAKLLNPSQISKELRKNIDDQLSSGQLTAFRIYAPEKRPLEGFSNIVKDQRVRYVVARDIKTEPLSYSQIPRQQGGHFDYDYSRWVKQPIIREENVGGRTTHWFEGDNTIMAVANGTDGQEFANALNQIAKHLKAGDEAAAEAVAKKTFPEDWAKVKSWFEDQRDAQGKITRRALSLDHPFQVVSNNKRSIDSSKAIEEMYTNRETGSSTFRDGTRSGSDAKQFQTRYTEERDAEGLFEAKNVGTVNDPIFKFEPAKMVDPIPSINRAMNNIVRTTFLDDYKMYGVENWIREAAQYLNISEAELRSSPFYHFKTALDNFKTDIPWPVRQNLTNNWKKIEDFVGRPSWFDNMLHKAAQDLEDAAATGGIKKMALIPAYALSNGVVKNPVQWMRSAAYLAKMGFYAPQQLFVNMMSFTLMAPLSPKHVTGGIHGAYLHALSNLNPSMVKHLEEKAWKTDFPGVKTFRPGWWTEARNELNASGFSKVGGEYVDLADQLSTNFIQGKAAKLADHSTLFFKKSEQFVRLGAYYTSFLEFRHANPTKVLSEADRVKILTRADDLSMNMSRASNSVWTSGLGSIPLQFFNYTKHAAEMFWGKRIGDNTLERSLTRARLIGYNSLLFGLPTGLAVTGLPVQDYLREKAIDKLGYNPGQSKVWDAFIAGLPAVLAGIITGGGDYSKGNQYNIGPRYGLGGLTQVRDALFADKTWLGLVAGVSGQIINNTIENLHPIYLAMASWIRGDKPTDAKYFRLTGEHIIGAAKEISIIDRINRFYLALSTGYWFQKNGAMVEPTSPLNAAFMTVTGLDPQESSDVFLKQSIKGSEMDNQKIAMKRAIKEWRMGMWAKYRNDPENGDFHQNNALAILEAVNYPIEKRASFFAIANKGMESIISSTNEKYYMRNNPTDKQSQRTEQYRNYLQTRGSK